MNGYSFYYDESEHSREINLKTISSENYCDNFITAIVGWKCEDEQDVQREYLSFEQKYAFRMTNGELKSSTIKNNQLKYGFASLNPQNCEFLHDFLNVVSKRVSLYFCVMSKIEYIVWQMFGAYSLSPFINFKAMTYSIVKAINVYKPQDVITCMYQDPKRLIAALCTFFEQKIIENQTNISLKERENKVFEEILMFLDNVLPIESLQWKYDIPFCGFKKYLKEKRIFDYTLTIDREGECQKTLQAAIDTEIKNVTEADSRECFGIRMADMIAGLIGKLMKSLCCALIPSKNNGVQKTILREEWFKLNNDQLDLYKQLHLIINELDNCWYKAYSGNYSDDLVTFVALLNFMNHFSSVNEIKGNIMMQGEYFNSYVCQCLERRYHRM